MGYSFLTIHLYEDFNEIGFNNFKKKDGIPLFPDPLGIPFLFTHGPILGPVHGHPGGPQLGHG